MPNKGASAPVRACLAQQLPLLIKGPTGCGKTRFVEHMAARLGRPLITVSCHDDLSAADLVGRHLIGDGNTVWSDGPLARAVRSGAICYLDEVVEARKDTTVVLHPLADDRRILPIERTGELLAGAARVHAGDLLQPRLPESAQGPQAQHPPALRRAGFGYPTPEVERAS
jgi:nitric oxide reductase NorQ protein